ncbi:proteasome ATPase [Nesterenkonia sp. MY13]|uniref:Proteasome ATPase n=1 Tax=Nesterenkonia sedimenti TaxID=1463632 RepID=A0A7X8TH81_9MICC|nr:proteasome ATPase [Nesterenkonia sedimenti]NLS08682.1 proteasome ATPase [Nesterenkonia sedimenti]
MTETEQETAQLQNRLDQAHRQIDNLRARHRDLEQKLQAAGRHNDRMKGLLEATRGQIEQLKEALEADGQPPFTFASVIGYRPGHEPAEGREIEAATAAGCDVLHSGRKMRVSVSPLIEPDELAAGSEVLLNENYTIIAVLPPEGTGEIARVKEVLPDGRLVIIARGEEERVVKLTATEEDAVRVGDAVVVDLRTGTATEVVPLSEVEDVVLEETPDVSYSDIGGLDGQIEQIRDAVELPFLHAGLYREHGLAAPKGILLYGPPGCGKTMIAKAVASSLSDDAGSGAFFLNIKGPELLNKYVGETERHIRVIFSRARERASEGSPVVVFFDEMEALFRTRGTGVSSDVETTIVPQLLAEIDGVESLDNVIVIGASNREDMIDPAILRPGRLDVKIRVQRPSAEGAREILRIHLSESVPLRPATVEAHGSREAAREALIDQVVAQLYPEHAGFMSGAVLSNIIDRAKKTAIKDFLAADQDDEAKGITAEQLEAAIADELAEQRAMVAGLGLREFTGAGAPNPGGSGQP